MQVDLEVAYAVACQALGETIVRERLLEQYIQKNIPETSVEGVANVQGDEQGQHTENGKLSQPSP